MVSTFAQQEHGRGVDECAVVGTTDLEEIELNHLDGHKGSKPGESLRVAHDRTVNSFSHGVVRIGNGASTHLQLDIYGE